MKRLLLAGLVVTLLAAPAGAADLATPTATAAAATPAASPSPDSAQRRDAQQSAVGGHAYKDTETFEGGLQIGKSSDGASKLEFAAKGSCTFNLGALTAATSTTGIPGVAKVSCTATGAAVGDIVLNQGLDVYDTNTTVYEALSVSRCLVAATDTVTCWLRYGGFATPGIDPGPLTINYVVLR